MKKSNINARPYQVQAVAAVRKAIADGHPSQVVAMATGTGKTHTAHILMREDFAPSEHRVLWTAHTKELIIEARRSALKQDRSLGERCRIGDSMLPGLGIVQAAQAMHNARWVYATVQTISQKKRLRSYLEYGLPSLIVFDEAHHSTSTTQQDHILKTLAWYSELGDFDEAWDNAHDDGDRRTALQLLEDLRPPFHVLGLTATPKRTDGVSLAQVFKVISFQYTLTQAIKDGYLKPFEAIHVQTQVPFDQVRVDQRTGEFVMTNLVEVLEVSNWVELVAEAWQEKMSDQPDTMVFMPSIIMSRRFTMLMNERGVPACHIDFEMCIDTQGRTTPESGMGYSAHRKHVLDEFKHGEAKLLSGFSALLEGFDAPNAAGVLWARPTLSDIVLTQGIGRGLRTLDGVARQLFDSERDCWLIQYDDGQWVSYNRDEVPFRTVCTILDFVDVQASLLTTGSLGGDLRQPASAEILEGEDDETIELIEPEDLLRHDGLALEDDQTIGGDGKVYRFKSLFMRAKQDWFTLLGAQSARLNAGSVLFIHPPQPGLVLELRKRAVKRQRWLEQHGDDAPAAKVQRISEEIAQHEDLAVFFDSYSAWRAECPLEVMKEGTDDEYTREAWWSSDSSAKLLDIYKDAVTAFERSLPYADEWAADNSMINKSQRWHSNPLTQTQLTQLTSKGFLINQVRKHKIPMPTTVEITAMNRGDASALRNHAVAHVQVKRAMDVIVASMGIGEDLWLKD
jgi:superfamily II DNA or RNA helicase